VAHLSRDELVRWRDTPSEAERARVLSHIAQCDACSGLLAELMRTRPIATPPQRFDGREFVERGYRAADPSRVRVLRFTPRIAAALAAAAAILLAIVLPGLRGGPETVPTDTNAVRGGRIQAIAPVGDVDGPIAFSWSSPVSASRYAVEVLDGSGQRVFFGETRETRLVADETGDLARALEPGARYTWTVAALDADGETIVRSAPREFTPAGAAGR
jgi:hypothetical protein